MSTAEAITFAIVGFFALLALLVFLRLLFRKGPPHWTQIRLGVYIERVPVEPPEEELVPFDQQPTQTFDRP